ncbi:alpha/beta fold hydrolase [Fodinicola feengrottensis]|uniref:alpha/beta fold hydrolase n=1 Tax=Fodinicola feengrottensis TaxID=435914 RepID=UPI0013D24F31
MTDVIILHGAWHQPAHFDALVGLLRSRDLSVEVPDLYELSLDDSTGLVEDIVAAANRPPLVLGHSFGGVTAGTVNGAQKLILLAGWLLDVGESPAQLIAQVAAKPAPRRRDLSRRPTKTAGSGSMSPMPGRTFTATSTNPPLSARSNCSARSRRPFSGLPRAASVGTTLRRSMWWEATTVHWPRPLAAVSRPVAQFPRPGTRATRPT